MGVDVGGCRRRGAGGDGGKSLPVSHAADCKIKKVNKDSAVVEAYLNERGLSSSLALLHTRTQAVHGCVQDV